MTPAADIPAAVTGFDPASAAVQRDPYPHYRWLLQNDPVHHGAHGIWYVSRYTDVRTIMSDPRFVRAGIRDYWAALVGPGPLGEILRHTILFQDEPDHRRLRTVVGSVFAPAALRTLESTISQIVDDLLDPRIPLGELDVINDLAYPLALTVISEVLGLPAEDRARLRRWSLDIGPTLDLVASPAEIAAGQAAMTELVDYLEALIARRRRDRRTAGDDLIAVLVRANDDGQLAGVDEIIAMVVTLIFAGHETVTNQIGNGLLALLNHRDQLELLASEPVRIPNAVEECLRYDSSVQSNSRQVHQDVELDGMTLRRGEFVVALLGAANRDPAEFRDPDTFDLTRTDIRPMSFGAGPRFCLGAILARLELRAALRRLVELNDMHVTIPEDELSYQRSTMFRGMLSLPVRFTTTS